MSSFDDIIKQKADGHEAAVPPGAWEKIMPQKKKRRFALWFWMLAALIIAGVGTPAYLHWQKNKESKISIVTNQAKSNTTAALPQQKNIAENTIAAKEKNKTAETGVDGQAKIAVQQNTSGNEDNTATTNDNAANKPAEQNKRRLSTKAKTTATTRAAELGTADVATNSTLSNKPNAASRKNKTITKRSIKKTTAQITDATIGETVINNEEEKPLPKENNKEIAVTKVEPPLKEKITAAIVVETKKQDSSATAELPATQPAATATKKPEAKKQPLFAEISILPFFPIQQTNTAATLTRIVSSNNVLSEFKSNNIKITIEPAVAFQMAIRKNISSRWQIGTGVQYAQLKETVHLSGEETTRTYSIINRLVVEPTRSYLVTDTIETITEGTREINAVNSYQLISVPIFAQYHAGNLLGCNISFTGGLFFNVYNHYSNSINPIISSGVTSNNNALGIDVYGGLRLSKLYGQKIELFAEPTVRFNVIQPNIKNVLLNKQIKQAGVAVGAAFKLN